MKKRLLFVLLFLTYGAAVWGWGLMGSVTSTPSTEAPSDNITLWINWESGTYDTVPSPDTYTLHSTDEHSAGDQVLNMQSGAVVLAGANNPSITGSDNGLSNPTSSDRAEIDISGGDIVSTNKGRVGFWLLGRNFTNNKQFLMLYSNNLNDNYVWVACSGVGGSNTDFRFRVEYKSNGTTEGANQGSSSGQDNNTWYFMEVAWNATSPYIRLYVDNVLKIEDASWTASEIPAQFTMLKIGDANSGFGNHYIDTVIASTDPTESLYPYRLVNHYADR